MIFDGKLNFWANGLYGFKEGQAVVFENAGTVTIGDLVMPQSVCVKGDGNTTLNGMGQIIGSSTIMKEGKGTLQMNADNAYTGGTQIKEGTVIAGGAASFGTGTIEVSGGLLDLGGYDISNEILLNGGFIAGASTISNQLIFADNYSITQDISARHIELHAGIKLSIAAGATLTSEEELKLSSARTLDLSSGGAFRGNLQVETDGVLLLSTESSTPIPASAVWHLNGATVSGNLSTAQLRNATDIGRTASSSSTLRISGKSRISGALTLNGGNMLLCGTNATLHAEILVLNSPTALCMENAPEMGQKRTVLTYDRLLSGTVTDYYNFFSIDSEEYELSVSNQGISISPLAPSDIPSSPTDTPSTITPESPSNTSPDNSDENTPPAGPTTPPNTAPETKPENTNPPSTDSPPSTDNGDGLPDAPTDPGPTIPGAEGSNSDNSDGGENDGNSNSDKDDPHGPIIDTSGNDPDDPHNNKDTESKEETDNDGEVDADIILSPEMGTALSQAAMQSAWSSRFASHAFMTAVRNNSRNTDSTTWAAIYGGLMETDDDGDVPGGDTTTGGLAFGAEAHPTENTQLGLALGGALGSITGEYFGELDQLSLHTAAYFGHSFLKQDSRYRLQLYGAIGAGRTETDPGIYSGLETWNHNSISAQTLLSWGMSIRQSVIWELYGGAEYYQGSSLKVDDESISGITVLSGSIGCSISWRTAQAILYAEAEFTGDMVRNVPNARSGENEYRTAEPERCGFSLRCGLQLHPEDTQRCIRLNYAYESRSNCAAHIFNVGISHVF